MAHPLPLTARPEAKRRESIKNSEKNAFRSRLFPQLLTSKCVTTKGGGSVNGFALIVFCVAGGVIAVVFALHPAPAAGVTAGGGLWGIATFAMIRKLWK